MDLLGGNGLLFCLTRNIFAPVALVLGLGMAIGRPALAAPPIIQNGDFAAGLNSWYVGGGNATIISDSGNDILHLTDSETIARQGLRTLEAGARYRFDARARLSDPATGKAGLMIESYDAAWNRLAQIIMPVTTSGFTAYSQEFVLPQGTTQARVIAVNTAGAWLDVDDVSLTRLMGSKVHYPPPQLINPITLTADNYIDPVTGAYGVTAFKKLDVNQDYIIKLPTDTVACGKNPAFQGKCGGIFINGGRNVVVMGGHMTLPDNVPNGAGADSYHRVIYIKDNAGTVHVEGVLIDGSGGGEADAFAISSPLSTVQIENVRVDGILGTQSTWHADIVQPWGGVKQLLIDHLTGSSYYQGLQIVADALSGNPIQTVMISNTNLATMGPQTAQSGGKLFWDVIGSDCARNTPVTMRNFYIKGRDGYGLKSAVYPGVYDPSCPAFMDKVSGAATFPLLAASGRLSGVILDGAPPQGDFVPVGVAGNDYISPGYDAMQ